jgi:hypothetical protein
MNNTPKASVNRIGRASAAVLALVLVSFTAISALTVDNKDTPDDVMRAGRNANAGLSPMLVALRETQAIAARLERDRTYATRVLEASKKNDRLGLAAILKSEAPRSQIQIQSITDFKVEAIIMTDGKQYYVCIGDGCKHRSGKASPVVFEED